MEIFVYMKIENSKFYHNYGITWKKKQLFKSDFIVMKSLNLQFLYFTIWNIQKFFISVKDKMKSKKLRSSLVICNM